MEGLALGQLQWRRFTNLCEGTAHINNDGLPVLIQSSFFLLTLLFYIKD